jgi:hypothetical protein
MEGEMKNFKIALGIFFIFFVFTGVSSSFQEIERKIFDEKYKLRLQGIPSEYVTVTNKALGSSGLIPNGNLEDGNFNGWSTLGDARIISKQGTVAPVEGNYMAIITTGTGSYLDTTSSIINNKFVVIPFDATKLSCDWNFLSNEYPQWVGTQYNDKFSVNVSFEDNTGQVLLTSLTLNSANWKQSTSGYNGETGWTHSEIDVSQYRYKAIKIKFQVEDVGDTIVDSALLIDNVQIITPGGGTQPLINSLNPAFGKVGDSVLVAGSGFGANKGTVMFNGISGAIVSWSDTLLKTTVPQGATTGNVVVRTADGKFSNGSPFTVQADALPTITIVSPQENAILSGTIKIEASASASAGIKKVVFYINGEVRKAVLFSPFEFLWDTTVEGMNGQFKISCEVVDNNDKTAAQSIWVNVNNTSLWTASVMGKVRDCISGAPVIGATVKIGSLSSVTSDSEGKFLYEKVPSGEYTVSVTKSGYETLMTAISIPANVSPVYSDFSICLVNNLGLIVVTNVTSKYKGFLHFLYGTDFLVTYTAMVDWGGHIPGKVKFITSNNAYEIGTSGISASKTFNIGLEFKKCSTLKVIAVSSDGTESKPKEADFVVVSPFVAMLPGLFKAIDIGDGYFYDSAFKLNFWNEADTDVKGIPDNFPVFGKKKLGLSLVPDIEAKSQMDGTTTIDFDWSVLGKDKGKKIGKCAVAGISGEFGATLDIKGEYVHPQCDYKWGGGLGLYGSFGAEVNFPFLVPPGIPMFGKVGFEGNIDGKLMVTEMSLNPIGAKINGELAINPELKGTLGVGFDSILNLAGWVAGGADWVLQWPKTPITKQLTLYVRAGVSATAFIFKWEQELLKWDWDLYTSASALAVSNGLYSSPPKLIPRDYLEKTSTFMAHNPMAENSLLLPNTLQTVALQQSVFPDSQPSLSSRQSNLNLVFLEDNSNRSSINRTMAVHAVYGGSSWNAPIPIWDDGTADFHPATVSFSDGTVIAAWEDVKSSMPDSATLDDFAKNLEISVASFNPVTHTWINKQRLSNNGIFDGMPKISGMAKDNILLTYIENESNMILGEGTTPNKIYYSKQDGNTWSAPKSAGEIGFRILKSDLLYNGTYGYLVLSVDTDGDLKTVDDHELYLLMYQNGTWGAPQRITNNSIPDDNPQLKFDSFGNSILAWTQGNKISSIVNFDMTTAITVMKDVEYSSNLADFKMAGSDEGKLAIVWVKPSQYSSDIFLHYYDSTNNIWGNANQISADMETERNLSTAFYNNKVVCAYNRDMYIIQSLDIITQTGDKRTLSYPQFVASDLVFSNFHELTRDLAIEEGSLISTPSNPAPGETILLSANVENLGDETASNVAVDFYDGDPALGGKKLGGVILDGIIKSGDIRNASFQWILPTNISSPLDVYAIVDPNSAFDQNNKANNKIHSKLFKPDLLFKSLTWQVLPNSSYSITARISNNGSTPSGTTSMTVRKNSKIGALISNLDLKSLTKGETVDLNVGAADFSQNAGSHIIYCVIDENNKIDELDKLNNEKMETLFSLAGPEANAFIYSGIWSGAGKGSNNWYVGDFNGDGKADIFRYYVGVSGADMFLSDGTQFVSAGSWTGAGNGSDGWHVGDFNGDGKDDILRYVPGVGSEVFLSNGSQFVYAGIWTGAGSGRDGWYLGDFNGDGKADLLRYVVGIGSEVFLSDGTKFNDSGVWTGAGNGSDGWYLGDFNDDGKCDVMRYVPGVSGGQVLLSDGTKFLDEASWTGAGNGSEGWYVGDFNGDGKADIFRYYPGVSGADMFLSDGTMFVSVGSWTGAGSGNDGWYLGDFNGDGRCDIFRYLSGVAGAEVFLAGISSDASAEMLDLVMLDSYKASIQIDSEYWNEERWLEPYRLKLQSGEHVVLYDIKNAYETTVGKPITKPALLRLLNKHDFKLK